MLLRFVVQNLYSFGEQVEFNMIPAPRFTRLSHHAYDVGDFKILKLASIYGANGAGKSNLIKAIALLKMIVTRGDVPLSISDLKFKFQDNSIPSPQLLAIEFIQDDIPFYYALEIFNKEVVTEELYRSGLGKSEDTLIFERKQINGEPKYRFIDKFESDPEGKVLKNIIEKNLSQPKKSILGFLTTLNLPHLSVVATAFKWFKESLYIINPDSRAGGLPHRLDTDETFSRYVNDIMCAFNIGINKVESQEVSVNEIFKNEDEKETFLKKLDQSPTNSISIKKRNGLDLFMLLKDGNEIKAKRLLFEHTGKNDIVRTFTISEQSDGTVRLLDFVPAFESIVHSKKVYIVDEIERSIHPLLIKELIKKFSTDTLTQGQLIFTTHESNLLDQEILRQDEIWFVEKRKSGASDLYSLSDFKEHSTIDIRKGYLNGRYGSIPFLGNLHDLNWHNDATTEETL